MQYTKLILTNCQRDVYQTTGSSSLQFLKQSEIWDYWKKVPMDGKVFPFLNWPMRNEDTLSTGMFTCVYF